MTPAQTLRHLGEGGGCSQRSRETVRSGEASEWKRKTHGRSAREKSFTGRPAANSSMDQGLGVEQRLGVLRNTVLRNLILRNEKLIGHRGATSQKLFGALEAARRELGEAPSRAALSEPLRKFWESKERSSHAAPRVQRREGNQRQMQPSRESMVVWQQTNAFAGTESQETVNHKEEAEHVGVWRSTGGVERRQRKVPGPYRLCEACTCHASETWRCHASEKASAFATESTIPVRASCRSKRGQLRGESMGSSFGSARWGLEPIAGTQEGRRKPWVPKRSGNRHCGEPRDDEVSIGRKCPVWP